MHSGLEDLTLRPALDRDAVGFRALEEHKASFRFGIFLEYGIV